MGYTDYTGHTIEGKFRILRLLGRGGMGSVYLGQHVVIGKKVAVKFLHAEFADKQAPVKRFYREAQAAVTIAHRNIIDVVDVGVSKENEPFLVMEYLEGESLASILKRGPIDLEAACAILEPTLLALAAAHEKKIVHRDLKPENIFLVHQFGEPPMVKLIDFGISKFTDKEGESKLTQTGTLLGTPAYMPPEQVRGDTALDYRADLYAVGVILYEMLTGKLPFRGEGSSALLASVLTDLPISPREFRADFPVEVEPLLMELISKDPNDRPESAHEVLEKLKALASFADRQEHLSVYASSITEKRVAGGDLGSEIEDEGSDDAPANVLAEMADNLTPSEWAGTVMRPKRWLRISAVIAAGLVALAAALWLLLPGGRPEEKGAAPPASAAPASEAAVETPNREADRSNKKTVQIEVRGAPEGATILYDNAPVPRNPFTVVAAENMVQLKVSAEGFKKLVRWVVPDKSQTVEVDLEPVVERAATKETPKQEAAKKPEAKRRKRRSKKAKSDKPAATTSKRETPKKKPKPSEKKLKYLEDFDE